MLAIKLPDLTKVYLITLIAVLAIAGMLFWTVAAR
jgi:hypothetical protein